MAGEMPDRIWVTPLGEPDGGFWYSPCTDKSDKTEYVRADLVVLATTHQRALEALREAREALLVFAAFSDKAERFVEHKAKFGGTAIFPVKDFRLAHFRKAVEVVALIDSILPGDTP